MKLFQKLFGVGINSLSQAKKSTIKAGDIVETFEKHDLPCGISRPVGNPSLWGSTGQVFVNLIKTIDFFEVTGGLQLGEKSAVFSKLIIL